MRFFTLAMTALAASVGVAAMHLPAGAADTVRPKTAQEWAQLPTEPARGCIWIRNINGFSAVDDKVMIVREGAAKRYKVTFHGRCPSLRHSNRIQVYRPFSSCLSRGDQISFVDSFFFPRGMQYETCSIAQIERIVIPQMQGQLAQ